MAINSVIHTNQHSIDRVLAAKLPVLLVFWRPADNLAALDPALDRAAEKYAGRLLVAKVNAQDEPALAQRYRIGQTPAVVVVSNGSTDATLPAPSASDVEAWAAFLAGQGPRPAARPQATNGTGSTDGKPVTLTDANFDQAINGANGPGPVLVDFWAPWCGPCRMVAPAVEQIARDFAGRAVVGKLNVDENPRVSERYGIRSIPTLYIFKGGRVVDQIVGAQSAGVLQQRLARHL